VVDALQPRDLRLELLKPLGGAPRICGGERRRLVGATAARSTAGGLGARRMLLLLLLLLLLLPLPQRRHVRRGRCAVVTVG
jgi:hypothetical protein